MSVSTGCGYALCHPEHNSLEAAGKTKRSSPSTWQSQHMPHSTFSWYHCWDLFLPGMLEGFSSCAPSDIFPCQLHSLRLSRDQRGSFYQVHERRLLQCQCHGCVHSVLLGLVKMWQENIFPFKKCQLSGLAHSWLILPKLQQKLAERLTLGCDHVTELSKT